MTEVRNGEEAVACLLSPAWPNPFSPDYEAAKAEALALKAGASNPQRVRTCFIAALDALGADILSQ